MACAFRHRAASRTRASTRQQTPAASLALEIVPLPSSVPAPRRRVRAACAISSPKWNCISSPAWGWPMSLSFSQTCMGRCSLPPRQYGCSSSGVTSTGDSAEAGLPCRKPKPLASSGSTTLRSVTSLTRPSSTMCRSASSAFTPRGTSLVITTISASRSTPRSSLAAVMGSRGPMKSSDAPWYMSGSVRKDGGISPRARRVRSTWFR